MPRARGKSVRKPASARRSAFAQRGLSGSVRATTVTFAGITALFAVVAFVASLLPAYRAARLEPMVALRDG